MTSWLIYSLFRPITAAKFNGFPHFVDKKHDLCHGQRNPWVKISIFPPDISHYFGERSHMHVASQSLNLCNKSSTAGWEANLPRSNKRAYFGRGQLNFQTRTFSPARAYIKKNCEKNGGNASNGQSNLLPKPQHCRLVYSPHFRWVSFCLHYVCIV